MADLITYLENQMQQHINAAREIADSADREARGITEAERRKAEEHLEKVEEYKVKIADEQDKAKLRGLVDGFDKIMSGETDPNPVPVEAQASLTRQKSIGDIFVESEVFKAMQAKYKADGNLPSDFKSPSIAVPESLRIKAAGDPVLESANTAWFGNGSTTAGALTDIQATAPPLLRRLTLADVIPNIPVSANTVTVPTVTTRVAISGTAQTEGSAKPGGNYVFGTAVAVVKTYAGWAKVSTQFLEDAPGLAAYINQDLPYQVRFNEEAAIATALYADAGLHVNGSGLTGALASSNGFDAVAEAIAEIGINGGEADTLVISPDDWGYLVTLKFGSGATTTNYVGGGPFSASNNPWGLRTVVTPAATSGLPLVLDSGRAGKIYRRSGLTVRTTNTDQDDFVKNLMTILAESRMVYKTLYTYLIAVCAIGSS